MKNHVKKPASARDYTRRATAKARAMELRKARKDKGARHAFALALA